MKSVSQSPHEQTFLELSERWLSEFAKLGRVETPRRSTDLDALAAMLIAVEVPDRLSARAHDRTLECLSLASNRLVPWVDQLPWGIARDHLTDTLGTDDKWEDALTIAANSLTESNSALRKWAMEIAWFVRFRIPREEAIQSLLENVATTLAYTSDAWGLVSTLFPDVDSFYQAADGFEPEDFQKQYRNRIEFFKKVYPVHWQSSFWKLEANMRKNIQLHTERHAQVTYNKTIPQGKREVFIDVAQQIADVGLNTPESFALFLNERFHGRYERYTQSLWGLIAPFDQTGNAMQNLQPDWEQIYTRIKNSKVIP